MQRAASLCLVSKENLLRHLRLQVRHRSPMDLVRFFPSLGRFMSQEAHGTYLDRGEVTDRVLSVVKSFQKVDPVKVGPSSHFHKDLGLDSLDTVEIVMALEEEFALEIPDSEADKINSCSLAIEYIASHPQAK